jgi:glycosyltransferase involved in cell wall biosynthesis
MVTMGLQVAHKFNIPLVADLHENWSASIPIKHGSLNRLQRLIIPIIDPTLIWKGIERYCVYRVDKLITIVEEARDFYVSTYGISPDRFTILQNTPDIDYFYSLPIENSLIDRYKPYFTIIYIGNFSWHRGVQTAIRAMPKIISKIDNAKLLLVGGSGNREEAILRKLAKGMEDYIEFTGQQPFSLMPSYLTASNVSLTPAMDCGPQTDASSPHKLFQAMAMGKPVVTASMKSLSRIITETGAGLVYTTGDADSLADAVILLYKDNALRYKMGDNARKAVMDKYNWDNEGKKLVKLYEELI